MTRNEKKRNTMRWLTAGALAGVMVLAAAAALMENAEAAPDDSGRVPGDDIPATGVASIEAYEALYGAVYEYDENAAIEQALIDKATLIDGCTVTFYTNATCGKKPGNPAYGITRSGMHTVEGLTCAVDTRVIPLYSDVFIQYEDGTIRQYWATDTGVRGNHIDVFVEDYDRAIQLGRKTLKVWWLYEG